MTRRAPSCVDLRAAALVALVAVPVAILERSAAENISADSVDDLVYSITTVAAVVLFLTLLGAPYWWRSSDPAPRVIPALLIALLTTVLWVLLEWNDSGIVGASDALANITTLAFVVAVGALRGFAALLPVVAGLLVAGGIDALTHADEPCPAGECLTAAASAVTLCVAAIVVIALCGAARHGLDKVRS